MVIKHVDLDIPVDKPFANCRLGREKYASTLTRIVDTYADGFVLAINNAWGAGKSTFVKMWQQHLNNEGHTTLYFSAWENDFEDNPLVALLSQLRELVSTIDDPSFKGLVSKSAVLAKAVLPALLAGLVNKYFDSDTLQAVVEKSSEGKPLTSSVTEKSMSSFSFAGSA